MNEEKAVVLFGEDDFCQNVITCIFVVSRLL
jgi:hypothetical protein